MTDDQGPHNEGDVRINAGGVSRGEESAAWCLWQLRKFILRNEAVVY